MLRYIRMNEQDEDLINKVFLIREKLLRRRKMGKFGWSLPPGCTMGDIDRAFGDQPTMLEVFESSEGDKLTEDDKKVLADLYEYDCNCDLIERILAWANQLGYQQNQCDEAEYRDYLRAQRVMVKIPKLRAYFKALRAKVSGGAK